MIKKLLQLTTLFVISGVSTLSAQEIIITEFLQQSANTPDNVSEYIEIYNTTNAAIVLDGPTVQYSVTKDDGALRAITGTIPAKGFFVLGRNNGDGNPHTNTVADSEYMGINQNSGATLQLFKTEAGVDTLIDAVTYAGGSNGAAYIYAGQASDDNSDANGSLWSNATVREGNFANPAGQPNTDFGSPGINGTGQFLEGVLIYENGAWSPSAPDNTTNAETAIVLSGTATFTSPVIVNNFQIRAGATLEIGVGATLDFEGTIVNDGLIRFKSDASGSGELERVANDAEITGVGEVEVERYFSNNRGYRMVSPGVSTSTSIYDNWQEGGMSPVGFGTHITGSISGDNGFDATTTGNPSLFTIDAATQTFQPVANTNVNTLDATEGYLLFVRGDRNVILGDETSQSETVLRTRGTLTLGNFEKNYDTADAGDFIMVGNPYQTVTRADLMLGNNNTAGLNTDQIYIFNPTLAGGSGGYETVNISSPMGSDFANRRIAPGIAFQVEVITAGVPVLQVQENDKDVAGNTGSTSFASEAQPASIIGELFTASNYSAGDTRHDRFRVLVSDGFTNDINYADAVKVSNFNENMAIAAATKNVAIERRATIEEGQRIQLYNDGYKHNDYTLVLTVTDIFANDLEAVLVDQFTGESIALEEGKNVINFSVNTEESKASDRFSIDFRASLSVNEVFVSTASMYPNPLHNNEQLSIRVAQSFDGKDAAISIANVLGQEVFSTAKTFRNSNIGIDVQTLPKGIYLVNVTSGTATFTKKLIIQ